MKASTNTIIEVCSSRYQKICDKYNNSNTDKIINSHFGEFSQDLVNTISNDIEMFMLDSDDKKGTVKRMFSILVEGLQNIRLHGEKGKDGHQTSFFAIDQRTDTYKIALGNLIYSKHNKNIETRITEVNKMTREEVKVLYMEVLTNGIISNKGGAGLGFITMAMKSSNNLDYFFDKINDDLSCFTLIITLDRKKKA
jgi:hypothetical protein